MKQAVGVLFATALVLAACQSGNGSSSFSKKGAAVDEFGGAPIIPPMAVPRFSDVPLPKDAEEDLERSFVYESRSLQIGRMVYTTKHPVKEVAQFYIQEAPKHNWKLQSVMQAEGAQLAFEKSGKRMWVNVQRAGMFGRNSTLVINLIPENAAGRTSVEPLAADR